MQEGDWWVIQVRSLNIHLRCKQCRFKFLVYFRQKRDVGFLHPRWSSPWAIFILESLSVFSMKYFKRSQFHPVAKQKKFEILKNFAERESYFLLSSISRCALCIQIQTWKGDLSTTALSLVIFIQVALFRAIHIYSFPVIPDLLGLVYKSDSNFITSSPSEQALPKRNSRLSISIVTKWERLMIKTLLTLFVREAWTGTALRGSLSSEVGFAGLVGVKASFEKEGLDLANTEACK